jgi:hypothetical protein
VLIFLDIKGFWTLKALIKNISFKVFICFGEELFLLKSGNKEKKERIELFLSVKI